MSNLLLPKSNFIHIPKCGGTLLCTALWRLQLVKNKENEILYPHYGHLFASQMPENGKPCFTFVRNPVTWWQSFYHWNMRENTGRFMQAEREAGSFDRWIDEYGQFWLGMYTTLVKRYTGRDPHFPTSNKVELIGRTEYLFKDLNMILNALGESYHVPTMRQLLSNTYPFEAIHKNIQQYDRDAISPESRAIILKTEKYVADMFGYK